MPNHIRKKWRTLSATFEKHPITMREDKFITKKTRVFTLGSCFAAEIRRYLTDRGFNVFQNLEWRELIWYNTFSILYEFQRAAGQFPQTSADAWKLPGKRGWQDPYRRMQMAETWPKLRNKIRALNRAVRKEVTRADVIIITLGMTEVFLQPNGRAICLSPGYKGGGGQDCVFAATNYEDNLANMVEVLRLVRELNPGVRIIVSVSPVAFGVTHTDNDHAVANMESKAILRAVAGELAREYGVLYFPSFELAMLQNRAVVYMRDGRHVTPAFVQSIMRTFEDHYVKED